MGKRLFVKKELLLLLILSFTAGKAYSQNGKKVKPCVDYAINYNYPHQELTSYQIDDWRIFCVNNQFTTDVIALFEKLKSVWRRGKNAGKAASQPVQLVTCRWNNSCPSGGGNDATAQ